MLITSIIKIHSIDELNQHNADNESSPGGELLPQLLPQVLWAKTPTQLGDGEQQPWGELDIDEDVEPWGENEDGLTHVDVEQQPWGEIDNMRMVKNMRWKSYSWRCWTASMRWACYWWGCWRRTMRWKYYSWGELDYTLTLLVGLQIVVHWGEVDTEQKHTFALKKVDKSIHFKAGDYKRQNGEDMKIHPVRKSLLSSYKERWPTRISHP